MPKRIFLAFFIFFTPDYFVSAKTHAEIGAEFGEAVVSVNVASIRGGAHSGTGFIVNPQGLVATARHVVKDAALVTVTFKNGTVSGEAEIIAVSVEEEVDLALLKLNLASLPSVTFASSKSVLAGDEITVIGNPRRLQNTITNGLLSQIRLVGKGTLWFQISAPISPSSSGSPVFNKNGAVIAMASSSLKGSDNQNLNFAIPSDYLIQMMLENGYKPQMYKKDPACCPNRDAGKPMMLWERLKIRILKSWRVLKWLLAKLF
jgi:S1-C subfamily serine protease